MKLEGKAREINSLNLQRQSRALQCSRGSWMGKASGKEADFPTCLVSERLGRKIKEKQMFSTFSNKIVLVCH